MEICSICSSLADNILNHMPCHPSITAPTLNEYNYSLYVNPRPIIAQIGATKMSWTPPCLCCVAILFPCWVGSFEKSPLYRPFCIFSLPFPITSPPTALRIETPKQQCSQLFATSYLQTREHPHLTSSCSLLSQ